jgi:hemerythrin-like metal-binding protein
MTQTRFVSLGIEMMDEDHLRIENLIDEAATLPDAKLADAYMRIADELRGHFSREEVLMRERDVPGVDCHVGQHRFLLDQIGRDAALPPSDLRLHLQSVTRQLIFSHVITMDRLAAGYLKGEISRSDFDKLRLPVQ